VVKNKKESKLQYSILKDLKSYGKYCESFKIEKSNENGVPDVFFTTSLTGAVFIEVKKEDGVLSPMQIVKLASLNNCGTKAFSLYTWKEWVDIKASLGMSFESVSNVIINPIVK